ncbi:MAG: hypothetical protein IPH35_10870 [Rhodoferax sp.]|nr:hypothetical protein [Rhodoferax sp.]
MPGLGGIRRRCIASSGVARQLCESVPVGALEYHGLYRAGLVFRAGCVQGMPQPAHNPLNAGVLFRLQGARYIQQQSAHHAMKSRVIVALAALVALTSH